MKNTWLVTLVALLCAHTSAAQELRLMAYNVLYDGADDAKSVAAIEAETADVVCLRELTPHFVKAFEGSAALTKAYPHRTFLPKTGTWGVGLASKVPLTDVRVVPVPPLKLPAMEATVRLDGADVRLVCVHLNPPAGKHKKSDSFAETLRKNAVVRKKQADTLVTRFASVKTPVVLLGDFNEEPGGEALAALEKAGWSRGCAVPGSSCSATWPGPTSSWPAVFMVDHVFARGLDFSVAKTLRAGGSDHYPVLASVKRPVRPAP